MANELLILRSQDVDFAVDGLDSLTKLGTIGEAVERPVYSIALNQLNKWASPKLDDKYKVEIHAALDKIYAEDYDGAIEEGFDELEVIIDNIQKLTPVVREIVESILKILEAVVLQLVEDKKG